MGVVALISWTVTVLAGATLFSIWLSRGGLRRQGAARAGSHRPNLRPPEPGRHRPDRLDHLPGQRHRRPAVGRVRRLAGGGHLGFTMARLWRQERAARVATAGADQADLPPEQHFPVP